MEILSDQMVRAFESMIERSDFEDALDTISGICDEIPPPSVVNDVIFKILMVNCTERVANEANAYLYNYSMLLPPKSKDFEYDYRGILQDKSGRFKDIWSVFLHLLLSIYNHHNTSQKKGAYSSRLVKYPNCNILAEFYVDMIIKFLSLENDLFEDNSEERFPILLLWINKFYKLNNPWIPILDTLHILLAKKVKDDILDDASETKFEAIIDLFVDDCPDIFKSVENMKLFFAKARLPDVQSRICQHKLNELIYEIKLPKKKYLPLTLKTLVYNYFFRPSSKIQNRKKQTLSKNKSKSEPLKKIFFKEKMEGDTTLHELCRNNLPGDLYEVLISNSELQPNARNSAGYTPLHVACLADHYLCARFLLEELNKDEKEKINLQAADNNGLTPLHCASYANSLDIVKLLLKHGGKQLVKLEDNFGKKAENYTKSQNLKKELKNDEPCAEQFNSKLPTAADGKSDRSTDLNLDALTVPIMNNAKEYSVFLYGLHSILYHYLNTSGLFRSKKESVVQLSHKKSECPHYISTTDTMICDEDASIFVNLPQLLDYFFACVQKNAKNINVEIYKDLLSLIILKKGLESF